MRCDWSCVSKITIAMLNVTRNVFTYACRCRARCFIGFLRLDSVVGLLRGNSVEKGWFRGDFNRELGDWWMIFSSSRVFWGFVSGIACSASFNCNKSPTTGVLDLALAFVWETTAACEALSSVKKNQGMHLPQTHAFRSRAAESLKTVTRTF